MESGGVGGAEGVGEGWLSVGKASVGCAMDSMSGAHLACLVLVRGFGR